MFADGHLTQRYRTSNLRFEVDGANAARDFLLDHGIDGAAARTVWLSIALHTTPGVPEFFDPGVALVNYDDPFVRDDFVDIIRTLSIAAGAPACGLLYYRRLGERRPRSWLHRW